MSNKEGEGPPPPGQILWENSIYYFSDDFTSKSTAPVIKFIMEKNLLPRTQRPKEITLIIAECSMKGYARLMYKGNNKGIVGQKDCYGSRSDLGNYYWFFGSWVVNHLQNTDRYKNPFAEPDDFDQAPRNTRCGASSGDSWLARTNINASNSWDHVTVCTCFKKPCKDSSNRLENKIYLF